MIGACFAVPRNLLWTPRKLNAAFWVDASDYNTLSLDGSNKVIQWSDKSGAGNHATTTNADTRPAYQASGFNGKPTVQFDGTDDFLGKDGPAGVSGSGDFFIAAVFKMDTVSPYWNMVVGFREIFNTHATATGKPILQQIEFSSAFGIHYTSVAPTTIKVDVTDISACRIATVGRSGGTLGNGGTVTVTATGPSQPSYLTTDTQSWDSRADGNCLQVGGQQQIHQPITYFYGLISEIIVMGRNATTIEREKVEGYLAHKWGLSSELPAAHPYRYNPPMS